MTLPMPPATRSSWSSESCSAEASRKISIVLFVSMSVSHLKPRGRSPRSMVARVRPNVHRFCDPDHERERRRLVDSEEFRYRARAANAETLGERSISACGQPHACAQEFLRVDRFAVDPGFVMQMRTGRSAGRPDRTDHLSNLDLVADLDADFGQMAVAAREAVAMVDFDHAAIAAGPPRRRHFSIRGRAHRVAHGGTEIEPGMHRWAAEERLDAKPEAGGEF